MELCKLEVTMYLYSTHTIARILYHHFCKSHWIKMSPKYHLFISCKQKYLRRIQFDCQMVMRCEFLYIGAECSHRHIKA